METVFGQTLALALWVGNRDEHGALELDTTGLNVKGNLYLYLNGQFLPFVSAPKQAAATLRWSLRSSLLILLALIL